MSRLLNAPVCRDRVVAQPDALGDAPDDVPVRSARRAIDIQVRRPREVLVGRDRSVRLRLDRRLRVGKLGGRSRFALCSARSEVPRRVVTRIEREVKPGGAIEVSGLHVRECEQLVGGYCLKGLAANSNGPL